MKYYGRYVDDSILVHPEQAYLKSIIPIIKEFLWEKLNLELHPRKIYLQHYTKGVQFLGTYIKPHRTYISSRTKNNFYQAIQYWNLFIQSRKNKLIEKDLKQFIASMNSYLGLMKHYNTYQLRKKFLRMLNGYFWNYVYISGGYAKLVPKRRRMKSPK